MASDAGRLRLRREGGEGGGKDRLCQEIVCIFKLAIEYDEASSHWWNVYSNDSIERGGEEEVLLTCL